MNFGFYQMSSPFDFRSLSHFTNANLRSYLYLPLSLSLSSPFFLHESLFSLSLPLSSPFYYTTPSLPFYTTSLSLHYSFTFCDYVERLIIFLPQLIKLLLILTPSYLTTLPQLIKLVLILTPT